MGHEIPRNYGMLVFSQPLSRREEFDPSSESVFGLLQGSSHQREEPTHDDDELIHTRKEEEALINERNLMEALHKERNQEEALHKERHLNKTHQPSAGGKTIDPHQDPQMDKMTQVQLLTLKSHTSRRKTKRLRPLRQSGRQRTSMMTQRSSELPHQHRPRIPGFCTRPGSYVHEDRTIR